MNRSDLAAAATLCCWPARRLRSSPNLHRRAASGRSRTCSRSPAPSRRWLFRMAWWRQACSSMAHRVAPAADRSPDREVSVDASRAPSPVSGGQTLSIFVGGQGSVFNGSGTGGNAAVASAAAPATCASAATRSPTRRGCGRRRRFHWLRQPDCGWRRGLEAAAPGWLARTARTAAVARAVPAAWAVRRHRLRRIPGYAGPCQWHRGRRADVLLFRYSAYPWRRRRRWRCGCRRRRWWRVRGTTGCGGNDKGAGGGGGGGTSSASGLTSPVIANGAKTGDGLVEICLGAGVVANVLPVPTLSSGLMVMLAALLLAIGSTLIVRSRRG